MWPALAGMEGEEQAEPIRPKKKQKDIIITSCRSHAFAKHRFINHMYVGSKWTAEEKNKGVRKSVTHLQGTNGMDRVPSIIVWSPLVRYR